MSMSWLEMVFPGSPMMIGLDGDAEPPTNAPGVV